MYNLQVVFQTCLMLRLRNSNRYALDTSRIFRLRSHRVKLQVTKYFARSNLAVHGLDATNIFYFHRKGSINALPDVLSEFLFILITRIGLAFFRLLHLQAKASHSQRCKKFFIVFTGCLQYFPVNFYNVYDRH